MDFRDAIGLVCMDTFTSSLAGFVIFSVLGFMSQKLGIDIKKVVQSGTSHMIFNREASHDIHLESHQTWKNVILGHIKKNIKAIQLSKTYYLE